MSRKQQLCLLAFVCGCSATLVLVNPLFLILTILFILLFLFLALRCLKASQTDILTGVSNLRGLEGLRHRYHKLHKITVVYLDVNELKQLNDNHGHEIGNKALQEVASFMLTIAGDGGEVYRVGGDEFILISENADLLSRWNEQIPNLQHVSISYGFATGNGTQLDGLIRTAERNMYSMKRTTKATR